MNMRCIRILFFLANLLTSFNTYSQKEFVSTGETGLALKHRVSKKYSMAFLVRSRYTLYKDENFAYSQNQIHLIHFSTFNFNYSHSLSLGLDYRNQEMFDFGLNEIRVTEQFNYIKQKRGVRYGHRVRAEQRIIERLTIFRQRYRFAVDFPLDGEKLDIGEAYLVISTEALWSFNKNTRPIYEQRLTAQIGWQVSKGLKLQGGIDYRVIELFNREKVHDLFLLTSAIFKI